jgi:acetyl esterase/lipase
MRQGGRIVPEFRPGGHGPRATAARWLCVVFVWTTLSIWPLRGPIARLMPLVNLVLKIVPRLRGTEFTRVRTATWRGEFVRTKGTANTDGAILYLHGGAFVFCGLATHRRIVERLALRTGLPVLAVEYRQWPKGRLPESMADSADAARWLAAQGIDPETIVYIGDSAGGFLAFATALSTTAAGVVGLSPWLDLDPTAKLAHRNVNKDVFIPAHRLPRLARLIAGDANGVVDPALSPVNGDLAKLPPVLIQCAQDEVLRVDAELMAQRLAGAGVRHTLQVWEGQVHAFPVLGHVLPESRAALDEVAAFVADVLPARVRDTV